MSIIKNKPLTTAYLIIGLACSLGLFFERYDSDWDEYRRCLTALEGRTALRAVIDESFTGNQPLELTNLPAYESLDPSVQEYLQQLETASASGNPEERRDALLELVPLTECNEPKLFWE